jgi:toxin ParE1/3/4
MAELTWSPRAMQDLDDICDRIARNSQQYARLFAEQVTALVETIPQFPQLGSVVPECARDDLRERLFQNYRIIYRVKGDDVEVVINTHGARRLPTRPPG